MVCFVWEMLLPLMVERVLFSSPSLRPTPDGAHHWNGIFCSIYSWHRELLFLFWGGGVFLFFKRELNCSSAAGH